MATSRTFEGLFDSQTARGTADPYIYLPECTTIGCSTFSGKRARRSPRHMLDAITFLALTILSNHVNHIAHTPRDPQCERLGRREGKVGIPWRAGSFRGLGYKQVPIVRDPDGHTVRLVQP